ncbi:MAG: dihydrofolate reductase [Gammaproteobacteria bacterium]|nr:dihydrofolate reductase [Gammaproteobacteria bacterium]
MRVSLVAALARNGTIGKDGDLPWRLPADLRAFKATTMGKPVIMGRKTWESIGRALPGRPNFVISRDSQLALAGATLCHSLSEALAEAAKLGADEAMVIGGAAIYAEALPVADTLILTVIQAEIEGDRVFPAFDETLWQVVQRELRPADEANAYAMEFLRLERLVG